jgi:hypothetical protein
MVRQTRVIACKVGARFFLQPSPRSEPRGNSSNAASGPKLLRDVSLATGVATLAGNLGGILVRFAMSAAVFLVGHAGTGRVGAFLLVSHEILSPSGMLGWAILELGCQFGTENWLLQKLLILLGELAVIWSEHVDDRRPFPNTHPASKREELSIELTCPEGHSYA